MGFYMPREGDLRDGPDDAAECVYSGCGEIGTKSWVNDKGFTDFYCARHFPGDMWIE